MLKPLLYFVINSLCCALYKKEYLEYIKTKDVEAVQKEKLFSIIVKNKATEYGELYNFKQIKDISDYQELVPITTYEDYKCFIEDIKNGKRDILTSDEILLFELTSGSISASKYIPYNGALKKEFQKGIKPWIFNLYSTYREIRWGQSYWSITPVGTKKNYTKGGIPIGFEEDTEYFGRLEKRLFDIVFAVPGSVAKEENMDMFYYKTCVYLLKCKNLTLISVWNPTYLLLVLEYMTKNADTLCEDVFRSNKKRNELRDILKRQEYYKLWKSLKVISCWCDGNSGVFKDKLQKLFPDTIIQPKGLISTEGFVSMPFVGERGCRISIYSHFFEFISIEDGKIYLTHQLEIGKKYSVIITTSGGLYRYKLNDIVEVKDKVDGFPLIIFIGRQDRVSDLFGEKLNEEFVVSVLTKSLVEPEFYMLAPEADRYVLFVKSKRVSGDIDEALRENFHYDYCRRLGQLKKLRIFELSGNPTKEYIEECVKRGQRLGDIKPVFLAMQGGWDMVFNGKYIS